MLEIIKGKSTYTLQFRCDSDTVNQLMQSYLSSNGFVPYEKKGVQYFRAKDLIRGCRGMTYFISDQSITINAWIESVMGSISLEQIAFNMNAMMYRNSLSTLFKEIEKLNGGNIMNNNEQMNFNPNTGQPINNNEQMNFNPNTGQPINNNEQMNFNPNTGQPINQNYQQQPSEQFVNQMNNQQPQNQFSQSFIKENQKKQETLCEIGFWMSILGFIGSFLGTMLGLLLYILIYYFATQGLKTRKKGKAIATIILSTISIFISIFQLIMIN